MENNEKRFIEGFNAGYILAQLEPQLLTSLLKGIQPITSYISGMNFGHKEYELEQELRQLNSLSQLRPMNSKEKDLERN